MSVVTLGGYVVAGVPGEVLTPAPPEPEYAAPVSVGAGVTFRPVQGWEVVETFEEFQGVRLQWGAATLDVYAIPFSASSSRLFELYRRDFMVPEAKRLRVLGEPLDLSTARGLPVTRASYSGVFRVAGALEGEVSAVRTEGEMGAVADAYAATGELALYLEEVRLMVDTIAAEPEKASGRSYAQRLSVGEGVTFLRLEGWEVVERFVDPPEGVRLERGAATLDLIILSAGDIGPFDRYVTHFLEADATGFHLNPQREGFRTASGLSGTRAMYSGRFPHSGHLRGEVSAIPLPVAPGDVAFGIVADGYAPPGQLRPYLGEIRRMVDGLELPP